MSLAPATCHVKVWRAAASPAPRRATTRGRGIGCFQQQNQPSLALPSPAPAEAPANTPRQSIRLSRDPRLPSHPPTSASWLSCDPTIPYETILISAVCLSRQPFFHQPHGRAYHTLTMFSSARRWLRRNRTPIAIGAGVIGAGYVVTQYILSRLNDARERMSSDRIAKEKYVLLFLMATQASMSWC